MNIKNINTSRSIKAALPGLLFSVLGLFSATDLQASQPPEEVADQIRDMLCSSPFDLDKVKEIIERENFDINQPTSSKSYLFTISLYCRGFKGEAANYFLDIGADPTLSDERALVSSQYTSLMWAIRAAGRANPDLVYPVIYRILEHDIDLDFRHPSSGGTALTMAAIRGFDEIVRLLLEHGADPTLKLNESSCEDYIRGHDCTPSILARIGGHTELALFLEGEDSSWFRNTLHYAARNGEIDQLRRLIAAGADINEAEPISGFTPLHYAAGAQSFGSKEALQILLEAGARTEVFNYRNATPLFKVVANNGSPDAREQARLLLTTGAGATADNATNEVGCPAGWIEFDWMISRRWYSLAKLAVDSLEHSGENDRYFNRLFGSRSEEEIEIVRMLLERGSRPEDRYVELLESRSNDSNYPHARPMLQLIRNAGAPSDEPDTDNAAGDQDHPGGDPLEWSEDYQPPVSIREPMVTDRSILEDIGYRFFDREEIRSIVGERGRNSNNACYIDEGELIESFSD